MILGPPTEYHIINNGVDQAGAIVARNTPTLMSGQVGQAILLGYYKAYLDFGSHSSTCLTDILLCNGGITISLWAYFIGDPRSRNTFQLFNTGGNMQSYSQLYTYSNVYVYCGVRDYHTFWGFGNPARETWYHFTLQCDNTDKGFFYLNAENILTSYKKAHHGSVPSGNFYIGAFKAGGESFQNGEAYLDDIRVFDKILSDNEIQQIYDDTK